MKKGENWIFLNWKFARLIIGVVIGFFIANFFGNLFGVSWCVG
jgi:uncharacterized membrane protein|tara:strand:- start:272 stop:400 length:129 start_codon:yes stop_codon:yes gene_type:complete